MGRSIQRTKFIHQNLHGASSLLSEVSNRTILHTTNCVDFPTWGSLKWNTSNLSQSVGVFNRILYFRVSFSHRFTCERRVRYSLSSLVTVQHAISCSSERVLKCTRRIQLSIQSSKQIVSNTTMGEPNGAVNAKSIGGFVVKRSVRYGMMYRSDSQNGFSLACSRLMTLILWDQFFATHSRLQQPRFPLIDDGSR